MASSAVRVPDVGASVLVDIPYRTRASAARLLPVAAAFARFGPELARLSRLAGLPSTLTFSPAWWQAVPPPRGYAHRLLLLHERDELRAAVFLRERVVLGRLATGVLHGSDAKGEALVLCPPGEQAEWLEAGILAVFASRRATALLLDRPRDAASEGHDMLRPLLGPAGLRRRTQKVLFFSRTVLRPTLDRTLAPLGHRTRRNLRHALRRIAQNGWSFLPELTPEQVSDATTVLATRSTHPYTAAAIAARLELEKSEGNSFSMGLRSVRGEWLSMVSGVRRPEGLTDIFWQANRASGHDSLATAMRALLMRHEGEQGGRLLRFIGGTSPLLEHCCLPDPGAHTLITRPGLRLGLLRLVLKTRLVSAASPLRKLLELGPAAFVHPGAHPSSTST